MIIPSLPFDKPSRFSLDTAGVASLLGGDDAICAMMAVHIYGNRRWLGWYNNPGSFQIAKRLSSFAKSASFNNISTGKSSQQSIPHRIQMDPTTLLKLDNCKGPKFRAAHSGTVIEETGYLASLFMKECAAWDSEGKVVSGRRTQPVGLTIADLGHVPPSKVRPARNSVSVLSAVIPIIVSAGACVLCAARKDFYASLRILLGMVANGVCGLVLGRADFVLTHPEPADESLPGDGIFNSDNVIVLRGTEGAISSITRGRFSLRFSCEAHYNLIRLCSVLFSIQCVTQLFLIPYTSLFGELTFLASLGVSASYNAWLSLADKEQMHRKILFERVLENPTFTKYTFGTRTTAAVFTLLVVQPQDPTGLLNELLPDNTKVWRQWKATILEWLRQPNGEPFQVKNLNGFAQQEKVLLGLLYEDALAAYNGYRDFVGVDFQ